MILGGSGGIVACCAVKAGIDVVTGSPARALAPKIRVMGVAPGVVDTDFVPGRDATFKAKAAAGIPPKRIAAPEDAADAILACATPLRYPTGSTILADGGRALLTAVRFRVRPGRFGPGPAFVSWASLAMAPLVSERRMPKTAPDLNDPLRRDI